QHISFVQISRIFITDQISSVSPIGLFLMGFLGSFFFLPIPIDGLFYYGILSGANPNLAIILVVIGSIIGTVLNYGLGYKLSKYVIQFVSLKKLYAAKRWVNRYGALAIFAFNLTPLPGSILSFGLGIAKYNIIRMMVFFVLAITLKFVLITLFIQVFF
ncbi:MAG: YqaA family protein, partial [Candidatus Woesearchaeota archaeon]